MHTKGGVIIGKLKTGNIMEISLPGSRIRHFRKQ